MRVTDLLERIVFGKPENRNMGWWAADTVPSGARVVSEQSATCLGPVFAAIRHIVDFGSTLPVDCYRENGDGTNTPAPIPQIIRTQDGPGYPGVTTWIGQAFYGLAVHGNAVGWIVSTDGFGYPTDVRWLSRQDWSFDRANQEWRVYGAPVPSSQLLHIPWIVPSGHTLGLSPIEHAAAMISAGLGAQEYADIKRGGGIPPSVLKNNRLELDNEQAAGVRERAIAAFTSGRPFVTGKDWDLTIPSIPPNHAQFIEILQMSANQIAAMYGLDPREVGGTSNDTVTYVNEETRTLNRAANMRPYIERFESVISRNLPNRQCIKLNIDAVVRTDISTRTNVIGAQIADGRLSVNEARALEDRPPIGPAGDHYNVPTPQVQPDPRLPRSLPATVWEQPKEITNGRH